MDNFQNSVATATTKDIVTMATTENNATSVATTNNVASATTEPNVTTVTTRFAYANRTFNKNAFPCSYAKLKELMNSAKVLEINRLLLDPVSEEAISFVRKIDTTYWPKDAVKEYQEAIQNPTYATMKKYLKEQLPVIFPQAQGFVDNRRLKENAIPNGMVMLDVDAKDFAKANISLTPEEVWDNVTPAQRDDNQVVMAHVTPSHRGLRVIANLRQGEDIQGGQKRLAEMVGTPKWDSCTCDYSRMSFLVPENYILFTNNKLLTATTIDYTEVPALPSAKTAADTPEKTEPVAKVETVEKSAPVETYHGLSYQVMVDYLVHEWETKEGNGPMEEGNRHNAYKYVAGYLRELVYNEVENTYDAERLYAIMGDFKGLPASERRQLCEWWCDQWPEGFENPVLNQAIAAAREKFGVVVPETNVLKLRLPEVPSIFSTLYAHIPLLYRVPCVLTALPALGVLPNMRFTYYHNKSTRALTFFTLLLGHAGSGKSSFDNGLDILLEKIYETDQKENAKSQEYKEKKENAKNKKTQPKPCKLKKRLVSPTSTRLVLIKQFHDNPDTPMYLASNEIDALFFGMKSSSFMMNTSDMRLAFDNDYITNASNENGFFMEKPFINIYMQGTYDGKKRFFPNDTDGTSQRWMLVKLPSLGPNSPIIGAFTEDEKKAIRRTADWLMNQKGELVCPWIDAEMMRFAEEKNDLAVQVGDDLIKEYMTRSAVYGTTAGYLASMLFAFDEHAGEEDYEGNDGYSISIENQQKAAQFARFVAEYQWRSQMTYFGHQDDEKQPAQPSQPSQSESKRQTILNRLSDTFTRDEAYKAIDEVVDISKIDAKNLGSLHRDYIRVWKKKGWIECDTSNPDLFHKN